MINDIGVRNEKGSSKNAAARTTKETGARTTNTWSGPNNSWTQKYRAAILNSIANAIFHSPWNGLGAIFLSISFRFACRQSFCLPLLSFAQIDWMDRFSFYSGESSVLVRVVRNFCLHFSVFSCHCCCCCCIFQSPHFSVVICKNGIIYESSFSRFVPRASSNTYTASHTHTHTFSNGINLMKVPNHRIFHNKWKQIQKHIAE